MNRRGTGARRTKSSSRSQVAVEADLLRPVKRPSDPSFSSQPGTMDWLVWQVADSAFPTGGFAHSSGLEAAWQQGELKSRGAFIEFVEASVMQACHASLPYVNTALAEPGRWSELDEHCDIFLSNHVANRASRVQGRAFVVAAERIFGAVPAIPEFCHLAPAFGACLRSRDLSPETVRRLFLFGQLRGVLAAAVRLNIVGPMDAQRLQHQLGAGAERLVQQSAQLGLEDVCQTSPVFELLQGGQDRLYSRLFQS